MTWVLAVETFILFYSLSSAGGNANLSINGLIGFLLLVRLLANGATLRGWVAESRSLPRRVGVAVAIVIATSTASAVSPNPAK